jgi:hypothetical protein
VSRWVEADAGGAVEAPVVGRARPSERAEQVKRQLQLHRAAIEACARSQRKLDPDYRAEIRVMIEIGADGSVAAVYATRSIPEEPIESCVLDVIRTEFQFPRGTGESVQQSIRF